MGRLRAQRFRVPISFVRFFYANEIEIHAADGTDEHKRKAGDESHAMAMEFFNRISVLVNACFSFNSEVVFFSQEVSRDPSHPASSSSFTSASCCLSLHFYEMPPHF